MELDVSQSRSTESVKLKIANHDICSEKPVKHLKWTDLKSIGWNKPVPYSHDRPLPYKTAKKGMKYITAIIQKEGYPFQMTYAMMLPLWYRFTEAWCDHGD